MREQRISPLGFGSLPTFS